MIQAIESQLMSFIMTLGMRLGERIYRKVHIGQLVISFQKQKSMVKVKQENLLDHSLINLIG